MSASTLNAGDNASGVYTGAWIDWSDGMFLGATWTLSNRDGLIIVSFLAIFVGVTGGHLWGILTYLLHQVRASSKAKDGLFHQEQVILRNSASASSSLWEFLKMGWAWRGRAEYSMWRMVPLVIIASAHLLVFTVAGIFSSEIFSTDQDVLVRSPSCGVLQVPNQTSVGSYNSTEYSMLDAYFIDAKSTAAWALTYARSCYGENTVGCDHFTVPNIESTFYETSCPFATEMCIDPEEGGALMADTGYINTNYHFGINTKQENSIDYRRVTTCAPLRPNDYMYMDNDRYVQLFLGKQRFSDNTYNNYTWSYDTYAINGTTNAYSPINYRVAYLGDATNSSDFVPIPQLNRTDADVTLIIVMNNVQYMGIRTPVDMWYNGSEKVADAFHFGRAAYRSPSPLMVMGCTEQHSFCQSGGTNCTALTGLNVAGSEFIYADEQLAIQQDIFSTLSNSLLYNMIFNLGSNALLAGLHLDGSVGLVSGPLPSGFWKDEIKSWQNYCMAFIQKGIVGIAKGPMNPSFRRFVVPPASRDQGLFDICSNVKIRSGEYYSFKILGLMITIVMGSLIILANCCLPAVVGWLQRRIHFGHARREDWELDYQLQLQRMAFEGARLGTWARNEGSIPVTIKALGMQRFGKPGRGVGTYESVDAADLYGDTSDLLAEPAPLAFSPSTGYIEYMGRPMENAYDMGPYKKAATSHVREFL